MHRRSLGTNSPEHMKTEEKEPGKDIADAKALGLVQLSGFEEQKGVEPSRSAGQRTAGQDEVGEVSALQWEKADKQILRAEWEML